MSKQKEPQSTQASDEKLQKVLARAGLGSRREMERLIESGRVEVNGKTAALGDRVGADASIRVDGKNITFSAGEVTRRVLLYNKPEGEICSRSDPEGRRTVYDRLPQLKGERWISVGRLDFNTSGLLLFTNDGELANRLMHPSSVIDREYLVRIQGDVDDDMRQRLLDGVLLEDGVAQFTDIVDGAGEGRNRWFYCVVMEGRNREVRRLWESQGVRVSRLKRVRYGNCFIPSHVRVGQWVELTDKEISDLCATAGIEHRPQSEAVETRETRERHERKLRVGASKRPLARQLKKPRAEGGTMQESADHAKPQKARPALAPLSKASTPKPAAKQAAGKSGAKKPRTTKSGAKTQTSKSRAGTDRGPRR
ncbi:23S rRNA pseudouridine2605 synthase [Simiduia aestuariiviva]|uniref:Pseudouridine synthase n=1 Tax=Simiduia aestuariiviva TaxID=1510459 RepID=A0A839UKF5_9GAMM|nr:23S rRNA pseudouridine2605 synthase [Simiduia aestuariiviva]